MKLRVFSFWIVILVLLATLYSSANTGELYPFVDTGRKPLPNRRVNFANPLADDLVAYWVMNEASGNRLVNYGSLGRGADCTLVNDVIWEPAGSGPALDFGGSVDYATTGTYYGVTLDVPFSLLAWVYLDDTGNLEPLIFTKNGTLYAGAFMYIWTNGTLRLFYGDGSGVDAAIDTRYKISAAGLFEAKRWYMVAGTCRGPTDFSLYIDGYDIGGTHGGTGGVMSVGLDPCDLGFKKVSTDQYFNGRMLQVMIWDRALTDDEVYQLYVDKYRLFIKPLPIMWAAILEAAGQVIRIE